MNIEASSRLTSVDFFKLFFALCVVALHTTNPFMLSEQVDYYITNLVFRLAVPYFFIASGYFLGKKLYRTADRNAELNKYVTKNLPFVLFYGGLYGLIVMCQSIINGDGKRQSVITFVRYFVFYPRGAMWFVLACIVAAFIVVKLWNHKTLIVIMAVLGYCFALLCNTYNFVIANTLFVNVINSYCKIFINARNGIFVGLPLLGTGIYMASNNSILNKIKTFPLSIIFVFEFLLFICEVVYVHGKPIRDDASLYITLPFLVAVLFEISLRIHPHYSSNVSLILRSLSGYIYFLHPVLGFVINNRLLRSIHLDVQYFYFLPYVLKILVCILAYLILHKNRNAILRKILP